MGMGEKTAQALQVLDHADTMTEHQEGIEGPLLELEDVGTMHVWHAPAGHNRYSLGTDVDGGDSPSLGEQRETVEPGSRADVEHMTPAAFEGGDFKGGEFGRWAEEIAHGQWGFDAVITPND
jgi:hypothetical protein